MRASIFYLTSSARATGNALLLLPLLLVLEDAVAELLLQAR